MRNLKYFLILAFGLIILPNLNAQSTKVEDPQTIVESTPVKDPADLDNPPPVGLLGGGDDIKLGEVSLYPNPGDGLLNIKLGGQTSGSIRVYDLSGTVYFESEIEPLGKVDPSIDLRHMPPGVYVVRVGNRVKKYRKI